ncbi:MAG: FMN-binding negative transcriptional regulator [Pseudomonadota bacterium]
MHPNPNFRGPDAARNLAFAAARGFGILAVSAETGPMLSHVPFRLTQDEAVELHLVRSNPILRLLQTPQPAVISVSGPDGYVSPDWYEIDDQVPTWNYVAVHLRGTLSRLDAAEMLGMLDRQTADFEARLAPKPPWLTSKLSTSTLEKMLRQIVPCRLALSSVDGTWKLNQNKPDSARHGAAANIESGGLGSDLRELSALMRDPP